MRNVISSLLSVMGALFCFGTLTCHAGEWVDAVGFQPTTSTQAQWLFAGTLNDENGDAFDYVFQMIRSGSHFQVHATLIDAQTKQALVTEDSEADLTDPDHEHWHVGRAFLRFNPINASWILGVSGHHAVGFNFKIDLLKPSQQLPVAQALRAGVNFVVFQTGELNGHLQHGTAHQETFVNAKASWFRQLWLTDETTSLHQVNGLLCQFADWSGFYSMNLQAEDAVRGAVSGAFDAQEKPQAISQFIHVQESPAHEWTIDITTPALHSALLPCATHPTFLAGFVSNKKQTGFCVLSHDSLGIESSARAAVPSQASGSVESKNPNPK